LRSRLLLTLMLLFKTDGRSKTVGRAHTGKRELPADRMLPAHTPWRTLFQQIPLVFVCT